VNRESQPATEVRRLLIQEGNSVMRQPGYPPCELPSEAVERIPWLRGRLLSWFERNGRSFPWRDPDRTPYEVVVAEILLQRTAAGGVARAYAGFIERYPSWTTLAHAPCEGLEKALRPFGLWRQKALVFHHLAQSVEERGGAIPRTRAELERLRGIGPYTASAVLAIVYGRAEPLLDVNMARLLGRFLGSRGSPGAGTRGPLHAFALRLVSGKRSLEVNWAVLDFGALVCRARRPRCPQCPLRSRCRSFTQSQPHPTPTAGALSGSRSAGGR
jgi:A/G-specific adenine glycosylase